MVGANHNFFNTEWTPGQSAAPSSDDFYGGGEHDAVCSPGTATRLSAAHQQTAGATYIATAARLFTAGDDQVRQLLDGSGVRASSAGPARVFSHAIGGRRTPVMIPDSSVAVSEGARICQQVTRDVAVACLDPNDAAARSGHFVPFGPLYSEADRHAAELSWTSAGKPVRLTSARPVAVGDARDLALRVMVPPNVRGTRFSVAVITAGGKRTVLGDVRVDGLPGSQYTAAHWAQEVRVPLNGVQDRVTALELTPQTPAGRAWLIDAWAWSTGTSQAKPPALPRLDLGAGVCCTDR
ncbi:hypothetical protein [Actinoplanes xinjiangensis]|uniref:hypothetical protein n=1 Tax=Actinoplanes xinjiangensis TaxID=512350 RepID=UPI003441BD51